MGGGGSSAAKVEPKPVFTGQMRDFGIGQAGLVQNQLEQAGMASQITPEAFSQTSLPIFTRPDEVELYLKSIGKKPAE
jgi:hypothetical protein